MYLIDFVKHFVKEGSYYHVEYLCKIIRVYIFTVTRIYSTIICTGMYMYRTCSIIRPPPLFGG